MKTISFDNLSPQAQETGLKKDRFTHPDGSVWISDDGKDVVLSPFDLTGPPGYSRVENIPEKVYRYEAVFNNGLGDPIGHTGYVNSKGLLTARPVPQWEGKTLEELFPSEEGWVHYFYNEDGQEINCPF
jgi:hypothetical protein